MYSLVQAAAAKISPGQRGRRLARRDRCVADAAGLVHCPDVAVLEQVHDGNVEGSYKFIWDVAIRVDQRSRNCGKFQLRRGGELRRGRLGGHRHRGLIMGSRRPITMHEEACCDEGRKENAQAKIAEEGTREDFAAADRCLWVFFTRSAPLLSHVSA